MIQSKIDLHREFKETWIESARDLAVTSRTNVGGDTVEVWVICDVERLCPELHVQTALNRERLIEANIEIDGVRPNNRSLVSVTIETARWGYE